MERIYRALYAACVFMAGTVKRIFEYNEKKRDLRETVENITGMEPTGATLELLKKNSMHTLFRRLLFCQTNKTISYFQ